MQIFLLFLVICGKCAICAFTDFKAPLPKIEVSADQGFQVSIPHTPGIELFAFHGNVNEPMNGREAGQFSRDITQVTPDGYWVFREKNFKLNFGDILYYWIYVQYNKKGYVLDNLVYTVTNFSPIVQSVSKKALNSFSKYTGLPFFVPNNPRLETTTGYRGSGSTKTAITARSGSFSSALSTTVTPPRPEKCERSETIANGKRKCRGELIFEDHFDTKSLSGFWRPEISFASSPDYEFCIYTDASENLNIRNGTLHIRPSLTENTYGDDFLLSELNLGKKCTAVKGSYDCYLKAKSYNILPPILSSKITTATKFSFIYGRIEIRAKLPKGDWIYPELFLESKNNDYGLNYNSGQLRIAFAYGNVKFNERLMGGAILGSTSKLRTHAIKEFEFDSNLWSDDFHTYALEWTPKKINLFVDGTEYGSIVAPPGTFASLVHKDLALLWKESSSQLVPFDTEMYITIGVGVGGHNFRDEDLLMDGEKLWQNSEPSGMLQFWKLKQQWFSTWTKDESQLQIDSVKVYAL